MSYASLAENSQKPDVMEHLNCQIHVPKCCRKLKYI